MRKLFLLASLLPGLSLTACASITRGTTDQIQITTEPAGAHVTTSLSQACTSPCTLTVSRKDQFFVSAEAPGYEPGAVEVKTQLAGAGAAGFAGNLLVGGVIGMGVDAYDGATLEHVPNPVRIALQPIARPEPPPIVSRRHKSKAPVS